MLANTTGSFPANLQGTLTLTAAPGTAWTVGNWIYVGTWATATFKAKVVKSSTSSAQVVVKRISGTLTSGAALKERVAAGGSDGAATGTLATISTATIGQDNAGAGGLPVNYGGWNLRETTSGIVRSKVVDESPLRIQAELLVAIAKMTTTRGDFAVVATFALGTFDAKVTPYDVSDGDDITFTITTSEPVRLPAGSTYVFKITTGADVDVGAATRTATLLSTDSLGTTHTFTYPVVAGDAVTGGKLKLTSGTIGLNGGTAYEIAANGSEKALSSVSVSGSDVTKTSVTIQA